ncbi:MAG TPA: TraB/GumN family protein [Cyclobacteriaceae bacterium]|nr:TraB/GumN family protein [Cyclobacteriaceae bacterium]
MRKIKLALFALAFSFGSALAQNSILWEVSGNGLANSSYLLGSLKFIGEKEYVLHKEIPEKLKSAKIFAIEDEVDHHAQHELNKALHFPKGESLATALSQEQYKKVVSLFSSEFNVTSKTFKKKFASLKPLALSIAMTRLSLHEGVKFYDIELLKMAKDYNLDTYSLEGIEREAQAFDAFPVEEQIKALMHSVENFDKQKSEYKKLEAAYARGDIDKVFEYSLHPFENNATFIKEFYFKRNQEWLPKLERMFADRQSFVAVGVTHLEGEQGLLALLKEKGYTLTPIPVTD